MTINDNNIITNNDFNSFIESLNNKNQVIDKRNKSTNKEMIIQKSDFDELYNFCIKNKYI